MKIAHQIKITVFSYEKDNEDENLALEKLLQLIPFNIKDKKKAFHKTETQGFNEKKIIIFEIFLEKEKHTNKFLENLTGNLDAHQKNIILGQLESRLDDNLSFFLRFDKEEHIKNSRLVLTDSGNCFHIEIAIAAFPRRKKVAIGVVRRIFS
ncbi:MAG: RNA-binding domain-containing protein [Nanoarchaeota archaeon]